MAIESVNITSSFKGCDLEAITTQLRASLPQSGRYKVFDLDGKDEAITFGDLETAMAYAPRTLSRWEVCDTETGEIWDAEGYLTAGY